MTQRRAVTPDMTPDMTPELVVDCRCITAEAPRWHPDEQRLYWVDNEAGRVFRYDPASGAHEQVYQGEVVGAFAIQDDGSLLFFMARGAIKRWLDGQLTTVIEEIPAERDTRFNDLVTDPRGRVYCGTMPGKTHPSRLYRLDPDGTLHLLLPDLGQANGMGFSPNGQHFYLTDTRRQRIDLFDYDATSGAIANQRTFVEVPSADGKPEGKPDGLAIDAEGYVWSARWGGGCIVRYRPDGHEVQRIALPPAKVSSAAFGGPDYGDLYITTAGGNEPEAASTGAGGVFRVALGPAGIHGRPVFRSRVRVA